MNATTLVLFSESYPYSAAAESTFIGPELDQLRSVFERIVIVPARVGGAREELAVGVEFDTGLAERHPDRSALHALTNSLRLPDFYRELRRRPRTFANIRALKALVRCVGQATLVREWVQEQIERAAFDPATTVFYTYWLGATTLGIGLCKATCPTIRLVSRAHRYDLYEEVHDPPYIPLRWATLRVTDAIFPISVHGARYLADRYPEARPRCETFRLGVPRSASTNSGSEDGVLRVASCSYLVPVKRVGLLADALVLLGRRHPDRQIEWDHFGGGPLEDDLRRTVMAMMPDNVTARFRGSIANMQVCKFYRDNPVDIFVNVSASEGIPVSIMEALSYGIPVIATAVGGTPEIVSDANGRLLDSTPSPASVALELEAAMLDPQWLESRRSAAWRTWNESYNAEQNFEAFSERLASGVWSHAAAR
jgi:glycosyltransferase involved in cell wall biosynthesis